MSEKLSINSELFSQMREQFDTILGSIIKILLQPLKLFHPRHLFPYKRFLMDEEDENGNKVEKQKINVGWELQRIIKAKKYKLDGRNMNDFYLEEDRSGTIRINKVEQVSLFSNVVNINK